MIAITTAELERRIHRFEIGEAKLEQMSLAPAGRQVAEHEAIENSLKATRQELSDMRQLHAERIACGGE